MNHTEPNFTDTVLTNSRGNHHSRLTRHVLADGDGSDTNDKDKTKTGLGDESKTKGDSNSQDKDETQGGTLGVGEG